MARREKGIFPMPYCVAFRPDATLQRQENETRLRTQFGALELTKLQAALPGMVDRIAAGRDTEEALAGWVLETRGLKGLSIFHRWWAVLVQHAYIAYRLRDEDRVLAHLNPLGFGFRFSARPLDEDGPWCLSRFALMRRRDRDLVLECPKAWAEVVVRDPRLCALLFSLTGVVDRNSLSRTTDLPPRSVAAFLAMLRCAGALCRIDPDGRPDEEKHQALAHWDVHDLYFHSRSRMGRHANGWATTYRFKGRFDPLPQIKAPMSPEVIDLHRPDSRVQAPAEAAPGFFPVLETRASRRCYASEPIHLRQLGEFLHHCFRVKQKYDDELGGVTFRPTPGGGALHSLELYVLVQACQGLAPGFYHYQPLDHRLEKIGDPTPLTQRMLLLGRQMMLDQDDPQVEIVVASRFQRIQWKYESIAYSVILKDVGCLYQTMYLVAEAMGLAGVALGGGDADLFAAVSGLDYFAEGSVGAFMLGSRRPSDDADPKKEVHHE
jgi:SagB-type dehydrogenase family enzyme